MTRPFSTVSIKLAADELTRAASPSVDTVLQKLLHIDRQIDADFQSLHHDLDLTRAALQTETKKREQLAEVSREQAGTIAALKEQVAQLSRQNQKRPPLKQRQNAQQPVFGKCKCGDKENGVGLNVKHAANCEVKMGVLKGMSKESLCELLVGREEAYGKQQGLVERLKRDNKELKMTYDKLWERYQAVYEGKEEEGKSKAKEGRIEHLSVRVQRAGLAACDVVGLVEKRLEEEEMKREEELFNEAGAELIKTIKVQREAHERLRRTVLELTRELERIEPEKVEQGKLKKEMEEMKKVVAAKDGEIEELKRQLNKVLAEYEAVKIAHSYSNAELSKIRATNRAKTKYDRHVKEGAEAGTNHHHHHHHHHLRKNYFR